MLSVGSQWIVLKRVLRDAKSKEVCNMCPAVSVCLFVPPLHPHSQFPRPLHCHLPPIHQTPFPSSLICSAVAHLRCLSSPHYPLVPLSVRPCCHVSVLPCVFVFELLSPEPTCLSAPALKLLSIINHGSHPAASPVCTSRCHVHTIVTQVKLKLFFSASQMMIFFSLI